MFWKTNSDDYGRYIQDPKYTRTYINKLDTKTRNQERDNMRSKIPLTSNEYGRFNMYPSPYDNVQSTPSARTQRTPRSSGKAKNKWKDSSAAYFPTINDERQNKFPKDAQRETLKSSGGGSLKLPDIRSIDVQLLTTDAMIGLSHRSDENSRPSVESYTVPRGVESFKLPDIKEMNVQFNMKDNTTYSIRSIPKQSHSYK